MGGKWEGRKREGSRDGGKGSALVVIGG